jgi:hypothetical protein
MKSNIQDAHTLRRITGYGTIATEFEAAFFCHSCISL